MNGTNSTLGPSIDHTYGNKSGKYLLLGLKPVFDDWVTVWDPADTIITCDICLRFFYSANMGLGGILRLWQLYNDTSGLDAKLVSVTVNNTQLNDWTSVEATIRFVVLS